MGDDRDRPTPDRLGELDRRLKQVRRPEQEGDQQTQTRGAALGLGFKIAVDLVCAIAVGVGIGYFLDKWLGTSPWFLLIMMPLGMAAGILNVMKTAKVEEERRQAEDRARHDGSG